MDLKEHEEVKAEFAAMIEREWSQDPGLARNLEWLRDSYLELAAASGLEEVAAAGLPPAPEEPQNMRDWLWRLKRYEKGIFVRHRDESGKWESVSLDTLDPKEWATHVARWLDEGMVPVRVREPEEIE